MNIFHTSFDQMFVKNGKNENNILESVNTCSNLEGRYAEVHGNIMWGEGVAF